MTNPNDEFPEVRLSDALFGDGFPEWGPRTELSDAVIADGLDRIRERCAHCGCLPRGYASLAGGERVCHGDDGPDCYRRVTVYGERLGALLTVRLLPDGVDRIVDDVAEQMKAQMRAAQEIRAAHADPHWLEP